MTLVATAVGTALLLTLPASAAFTFSNTTAAAPTYGTTLNFDEPGTPLGTVPSTSWASLGITIGSGDNPNTINCGSFPATPWVGNGTQAIEGVFGISLHFSTAMTSLSFQAWDPSGPAGPFGGGLVFAVTNADGTQFIDGIQVNPAWGGVGKTWYNLTTTGGSTFQHIVVFGSGEAGPTYIDNLSWDAVPAPGGLALLAVFGIAGGRRRRA